MNPGKDNISDFLSKNVTSFYIPPFQRSYAWGKQEIDRYFDDISCIIESERNNEENDKKEHFFGVLVLKQEGAGPAKREIIVDGQQRLTTTLLLLIALRDSEDDENKIQLIENTYLTNPTSTFDDKIKLKQVTSDWDAYRALIKKKTQIDGPVTDGYNRFKTLITNANYSTDEYFIALSRVNVAWIYLDERPHKGEDPQIIFETLNSLGKPLSLADLVRNYILLGMETSSQTEVFEDIWHPDIEEVLQEKSSHYFRDYLQYKKSIYLKVISDSNTKELYAKFKEFVERDFNNDKQAFIDDILRYVDFYVQIIDVNENVTISNDGNNNQIIKELLRNIFHDIGADAFKPLILGLLEYRKYGFDNKKLTDNQLIESLTVIRTYLIRRRVLKLTQGENKDIVRLCAEIKSNTNFLTDARKEMLTLLSKGIYRLRLPNDSEITEELRRVDFYNGLKKYSKFILGTIEAHISRVAVDFRDTRITIEHVMPQKIERSKAWKREIGEDWEKVHNSYKHNIGNLILTEFNSEMGNQPLKDKKEKLHQSNLLYRNDVLNRSTWNCNDMLAHQSEMIERFLETFPLPIDMQNSENWSASDRASSDELFSPLDDEVSEAVTGQKPKAMMIYDDDVIEVKTWQDVYLAFLRWIYDNKSIIFGRILDQKEGAFSSKHAPVANKQMMQKIIRDMPELDESYKRLSDGVYYSKSLKHDEENSYFIYIKLSAKDFIDRIRQVMEWADMTEESLTIELKKIRPTKARNAPFHKYDLDEIATDENNINASNVLDENNFHRNIEPDPAAFYDSCIQKIGPHLNTIFQRKGRTIYESIDGQTGVILRVSKRYLQGDKEKYWFAYTASSVEALSEYQNKYIAFGCGNADNIIIMPQSDLENMKRRLNSTSDSSRTYWHIVFFRDTGGNWTWLLSEPYTEEISVNDKLIY